MHRGWYVALSAATATFGASRCVAYRSPLKVYRARKRKNETWSEMRICQCLSCLLFCSPIHARRCERSSVSIPRRIRELSVFARSSWRREDRYTARSRPRLISWRRHRCRRRVSTRLGIARSERLQPESFVMSGEHKTVIKYPSEYVKLNIGGSLHYTTIGTLQKHDTMLRAMFSGRMEVLTDSEGKTFPRITWGHVIPDNPLDMLSQQRFGFISWISISPEVLINRFLAMLMTRHTNLFD